MAVREVFVSDLTGEEINGNAARVTIHLTSAPAKVFVLDAREEEVASLVEKAHAQTRRGRKPKTK